MKNRSKITAIITFQIFLIVASFLAIATLESQLSSLGNTVNVAGKNRFLASQFMDELKDWAYVKNPHANPEIKLKVLEENIQILKNGGNSNGVIISPERTRTSF